MGYFVAAIGAVAGSMIVNTFGFNMLFIGMFVFALVGAVVSFLLLRKKDYLSSLEL